jgi:hypothetical protein
MGLTNELRIFFSDLPMCRMRLHRYAQPRDRLRPCLLSGKMSIGELEAA